MLSDMEQLAAGSPAFRHPQGHEGKQPELYSVLYCQYIFDTVLNKLWATQHYCKMVFVWDNFAQLWANVSVLSTFKKARLGSDIQ